MARVWAVAEAGFDAISARAPGQGLRRQYAGLDRGAGSGCRKCRSDGLNEGLPGAAVLFAALGDEMPHLAAAALVGTAALASISVLADRFDLTRQGVTKHLNVLACGRHHRRPP